MAHSEHSPGPALLTVEETAQAIRVCRTRVFALIKSGELRSVKIGRSRRIPTTAVEQYVSRLVDEQNGGTAA